MRKTSCFLITKKPLLLEGRKSHFFWMKIPTSSGNRESGLFFLATGPKKPLYTPVTGSSRTVVLEENVDWKDIIWGLERVRINKRLIHLRYLVFYPNS